ncbi:hypothetical protein D3C78_1924320 [compost metagenome]
MRSATLSNAFELDGSVSGGLGVGLNIDETPDKKLEPSLSLPNEGWWPYEGW